MKPVYPYKIAFGNDVTVIPRQDIKIFSNIAFDLKIWVGILAQSIFYPTCKKCTVKSITMWNTILLH